MRIRRRVCAALALGIAVVLVQPSAAQTGELKMLCSNGLRAVAEELVPQFERTAHQKVAVTYGLAAGFKQRIEAGESFDLAVLTPGVMDDLIKQGKIAANTRTPIARSGLGLVIRAGGRKPDIGTVDTLKRTLLDAKSIAYAKEGASGVAFVDLIKRLGIEQALQSKSKLTATGEEVGQAVTRGGVEFGVLPVSEILPIRGAELGATFPETVQSYIVMVAGVSASANQAGAARDLIKFLTGPSALSVFKAKGMEPSAH